MAAILRFLPRSALASSRFTLERAYATASTITSAADSESASTQALRSDEAFQYVRYPYFINRTQVSGSLPVYMERRGNGRQQIITVIRKIDGDLEALRKDLLTTFPETKSLVNPHSRQVILKGNLEREVKLFLRDQGF